MDKAYETLKGLEERFLSTDEKTGDPALDSGPDAEEWSKSYSENDEIDSFMAIAQNSALSAYLAVDMLLKHGNKEQLDKHFGSGSGELLEQTKECLEGIAGMFDGEQPEELEEPEEVEEPKEEPTAEEKPEEAPEDKPEEK